MTTSEGRDKIVNRLTDLESVFIEYVALGRNTTTENVKANFGRGGIMLSRKALQIGMIDKIQSELKDGNTSSQINVENNTLEGENMADITMSEEALNKLVAETAQKAVMSATESFNASLAERDAKKEAEEKRKSGFTTLLNKYPKMTGMINEEMNKGVEASLEFGFAVADADAARISAENEQNANANANTGDGSAKDPLKKEDSKVLGEVSALAGQFGIDLGGLA